MSPAMKSISPSSGVNSWRDLPATNHIIDINILFVIGPRFELVGGAGVCMPGGGDLLC
jgi:hypothetical protein